MRLATACSWSSVSHFSFSSTTVEWLTLFSVMWSTALTFGFPSGLTPYTTRALARQSDPCEHVWAKPMTLLDPKTRCDAHFLQG